MSFETTPMKKNIIILSLVAVAIIAAGVYVFELMKEDVQQGCTMEAKLCPDGSAVGRSGPNCEFEECPEIKGPDAENGTYAVEGEAIKLEGGYFRKSVGGGSSEEVIHFFGNSINADFNGDGVEDEAFLLTKQGSGSGAFFYIAALVSTGSGYAGTNAIFLGDRIAPQPISFIDGKIIANYADRKPGEPFTTQPSLGVSRYFKIVGAEIVETENPDKPVSSCTCPAGYYLDGETCNPECYKSTPKCLMPSVACTKPITNFMECVAAGNPISKSKPAQCQADGKVFFEDPRPAIYCTPEQRKAEVCAEIYAPVCAKVNIQCIKAPCLPIFETIENPCRACANQLVEFYTNGECPSVK